MSKTRNIYFVRHGQTDANATGVVNSGESMLTQKGIAQAQALANRLTGIEFSVIYTSELQRAIDTGVIVGGNRDMQILNSSLLNERRKPSNIGGLDKKDPKYLEFLDNFLVKAREVNYRYGDGENIYDVVQRIKQFLSLVHRQTVDDVVVVTHGAYLRLLSAYILTQSEDMNVYAQAYQNIIFDNTGITHVKLDTDGHWQFGTINDSTHLS